MNASDLDEIRIDVGKAMTLAAAKTVMKKFLRRAGAGYINSCPRANNAQLQRLFQTAAQKLVKVSVPLPAVKIAVPQGKHCFCAVYSDDGDPVITWLYFDDLKKGVVFGTFSVRNDAGGFFSPRAFWPDDES